MANTYQGFSPVDFARAASTTLTRHVREVEDAWVKNYQLGALLEANGRIMYNLGGRGFDWPVQFRLHNLEGNTGETTRNFTRTNLWKVANLEFRGYQATDAMYYREFLENRGPEGIVKVYDQFTQRLEKSIRQGLGPEYYVDGSASGNESSWHGFESMFAATQTVNSSTGAARTANAADFVGYPNDTYAGISTVLGNYGGENESGVVWPKGVADPQYDFWSPLLVNYTCTGFGGAADTWAAQGDEALRYAIIHSQRNSSIDGQITNVVLERTLFFEFLNLIDGKEQINVNRGSNDTGLVSLGFKNIVWFDGVEVSWEGAVPNAVGYGYNLNNIMLNSMDETLFRPEGPEYDMATQSFRAVVSTLSNLQYKSPRNCFKLLTLA